MVVRRVGARDCGRHGIGSALDVSEVGLALLEELSLVEPAVPSKHAAGALWGLAGLASWGCHGLCSDTGDCRENLCEEVEYAGLGGGFARFCRDYGLERWLDVERSKSNDP